VALASVDYPVKRLADARLLRLMELQNTIDASISTHQAAVSVMVATKVVTQLVPENGESTFDIPHKFYTDII
jgi:hypothetical protein